MTCTIDLAACIDEVEHESGALWQAHEEAKQRLADEINHRVNAGFDQETFTVGFARHAAGWPIGDRDRGIASGPRHEADAQDLYCKLEAKILPAYHDPMRWAEILRYTIALNASCFTMQRMRLEDLIYAYQDR